MNAPNNRLESQQNNLDEFRLLSVVETPAKMDLVGSSQSVALNRALISAAKKVCKCFPIRNNALHCAKRISHAFVDITCQ